MAAQAIFEKRDGMTVIRMPEGRPFRILQLTDIHIGGGLLSRKKDRLALDAVGKRQPRRAVDFHLRQSRRGMHRFLQKGTFSGLLYDAEVLFV